MPRKPAPPVAVMLRVPADMYGSLSEHAETVGLSVPALVRHIVATYYGRPSIDAAKPTRGTLDV